MIHVNKTEYGYEMILSRSNLLNDPENKTYSGDNKSDVLELYYKDVDKLKIGKDMKKWRKQEMKRFFDKHVA